MGLGLVAIPRPRRPGMPHDIAPERVHDVLAELNSMADPSRRAGMARVGIDVDRALGVSVPNLRSRSRAPAATTTWRSRFGRPRSTRRASSPRWSTSRRGSPRRRWRPGSTTSIRGTSATGVRQPVRPHPFAFRKARAWTRDGRVREARRVRARWRRGRPPQRRRRARSRSFLPSSERSDRRPQLREEGGELGAAPDRQTEPGAQRRRDRRGRSAHRARLPQRRWIAARRPPRAEERRGPGAPGARSA